MPGESVTPLMAGKPSLIEHSSSTNSFDPQPVEHVQSTAPLEPSTPSLIEHASTADAFDANPVESAVPAPVEPVGADRPGTPGGHIEPAASARFGRASSFEHSSGTEVLDGHPSAPVESVTLEKPIQSVARGALRESAIPDEQSASSTATFGASKRASRATAGAARRAGVRRGNIRYRRRVGALVATLGVLAIAVSGGWRVAMGANPPRPPTSLNPLEYPGGEALASGVRVPHARMRPSVLEAPDDVPQSTADGCISDFDTTTLITCDYGDTSATRTLAVVGSSHAEHWLPALDILAHRHRFRLRVMFKMGCPLTVSDNVSYKGQTIPDCRDWSRQVIDLLGRQRPDWVFTTGTRPRDGVGDETPQDYLDVWSQLSERGLNVLAMRDTPWLRRDGVRYRATDCLARGGTSSGCGLPRDYALDPVDPEIAPASRFPNVVPIDLTDAVCAPDVCPVSAGNILIYHDEHHLTATYSRSLAPALERTLRPILGWW
nr:SGNH hydrolase domain-containing protein [Nocardia alni]